MTLDGKSPVVRAVYTKYREIVNQSRAGESRLHRGFRPLPPWDKLTANEQKAWMESIDVAYEQGRVDEQFGEDS